VPVVHSDGTELYWESTGGGPPVLLVMGLGMNATAWWRTIPVLAERFRVIAFDNRGVGRSGRPAGPYTVAGMAADAMAVLDAAEEETAHVYGLSLGGMISQEIALRHPERLRALVLAATTPGGSAAVPAGDATQTFFRRRAEMPADEAVWASVPYNYGPATRRLHGDRIAQDIEQRLRFPIESEPYTAQLEAALGHDALDRLGTVTVPTLVVHGAEDRLIHPGNAELLAHAIPGSGLLMWPEAGHLLFTDAPEIDRIVGDFLSAPSSPGPWSRAPR
jgi:pimeloyl-ACP methyl ester carboxylesterase